MLDFRVKQKNHSKYTYVPLVNISLNTKSEPNPRSEETNRKPTVEVIVIFVETPKTMEQLNRCVCQMATQCALTVSKTNGASV